MNNLIQLVFDPNEFAVARAGHLVKVYRLDEEAKRGRKSRIKRKRKVFGSDAERPSIS